jgi:tubulin monoglycylase TTLL3/8
MRDLFPAIERLVTDSFRAVHNKIDPKRLHNSFEIFGYDFMIDEQFKVYMIEANTNPCLEICCPLLARIIPELLDNSFRIAVDPLYQPPSLLDDKATEMALQPTQGKKRRKFEQLQHIKYRLVYDELIDGPELNQLFKSTQTHNQQLMAEIMEEELICAKVAKENEQKAHESIDELPIQAVILPIQSDSD